FVESVVHEIIRPGVDQLMNSRYFTELRAGKLSKKRLAVFAMQHYLSNHAINKGLAFCMVKNASNPPAYNQFVELFVENLRPGVVDRLGVGYEEIQKINRRIIYCSISAFGQHGPYRKKPGYDTLGQALSGLLSVLTDREK